MLATIKLMFTKGNSKLKKALKERREGARRAWVKVYNFNLRAIETCPGATALCKALCYADKGRYTMNVAAHQANREIAESFASIVERVENLPANAWIRIHTSGDFYSAEYVERWRLAAILRQDVRFWAYTRSWAVPEILPALERFKVLPNVQVFASTDESTIGAIPDGWREAALLPAGVHEYDNGLTCPEQTGRMSDCADCGYCILGQFGNVGFIQH